MDGKGRKGKRDQQNDRRETWLRELLRERKISCSLVIIVTFLEERDSLGSFSEVKVHEA